VTEFVDEKTSDGHGSGAYQKAHTAFLTQGKNNSFFIITSEVASNHHVSFRKWQSAIVLYTEQGDQPFQGFLQARIYELHNGTFDTEHRVRPSSFVLLYSMNLSNRKSMSLPQLSSQFYQPCLSGGDPGLPGTSRLDLP